MSEFRRLAGDVRTAAIRLLERASEHNRQTQYAESKNVALERLLERIVEHLDADRLDLRALLDDDHEILKLTGVRGLEPGLREEADKVKGLFRRFLRAFTPEAIRQLIRDAGGIRAYLKQLRSEAVELIGQADEYYLSRGMSPDEHDVSGILRRIAERLDREDPTMIDTKSLKSDKYALFRVGSDEGLLGIGSGRSTFDRRLGDFSFRLGEVLKVLEEDKAMLR